MSNNQDDIEFIFIEYEGVIRHPGYRVIDYLSNDEDEQVYFGDAIDFNYLKQFNDLDISSLLMSLEDRNILSELYYGNELDDDDLEIEYDRILSNIKDLYSKSPLLQMGDSLNTLIKTKFVNKVYIYHPTNDDRVKDDIEKLYGSDDRVSFVYGDLHEVMKKIPEKITTFILGDIEHFFTMTNHDYDFSYTNVLIAKYHYNCDEEVFDNEEFLDENGEPLVLLTLNISDIEKVSEELICKIAEFIPINIDSVIYDNEDWEDDEDEWEDDENEEYEDEKTN